MKTCRQCKIEKPFDAFWRSKTRPDGHLSYCIECERLRRLELKKNPLMQLEKQIRSSVLLENKLLKRENKKLCTACKEIFLIDDLVSGGTICKECSIEKNKEYNEKNKEKRSVYRENNKEKKKKYMSEYYEKNKEKINEARKEYLKEYRKKNKEKTREYQRGYDLKKKLEKQKNT